MSSDPLISKKSLRISFRGLALLAAVVWTTTVLLSLRLQYQQSHEMYQYLGRAQAKSAFQKDLVYRRWATMHGGAYVPIDSSTPANPYLANVPERDIVTPSGRSLTLMNPAYIMRQTYAMMGADSLASGHITSLNPLRPENAPDPWERKALEAFAKGEKIYETLINKPGDHQLRHMEVLYAEKGCLKCHGIQGYKEGDVRGGIAVSIPMNDSYQILEMDVQGHFLRHGVALLVGLFLIGIAYYFVQRHARARQKAEFRLRNMVEEQESVIHAFSHDIRTPMVTLAGFSNELGQTIKAIHSKENPCLSVDEQTEIQEQIQFIQEAVSQLRTLQDGILGYTRLWRESLDLQKIRVREIWFRILESRATIIEIKKAQIHTGLLPTCHGDAKAMELLLSQLLDNSLKFAPDGLPPVIHFEGIEQENSVIYTVSDQGIGIPEKHRTHVFELFHRLNPQQSFGGSGLGLSVVKFLVLRMGGQVELANNPHGKGIAVRLIMRK